jgi:hypothetical protein
MEMWRRDAQAVVRFEKPKEKARCGFLRAGFTMSAMMSLCR